MLSSAHSVNVLALRGDKADDPDQYYPVRLPRGRTSTNHFKVQPIAERPPKRCKASVTYPLNHRFCNSLC
ncbi:hypothetical protein BDW59DRAFT_152186 [Aspergillus cavernicola]|uniref:Uncharacterized protein n=1 Tax=Aspergillus cavernicola TaxID=176166 RepID=A0ABR4HRY7_9EURO